MTDRDRLRALEEPTRLSASVLWDLQRRYFETAGVGAWATGEVPSYATSNAVVAHAYARLLAAFVDDCRDLGSDHPSGPRDPAARFDVIEIGSGSARLGFLLARELHARPGPAFRVILTDFVPATLEAWAERPELRGLCEVGALDFALFDADDPGPLVLWHSGEVVGPGANPLAAIANYVVDTLRQDAFAVDDGQLYEIAVTASVPEASAGLDDPRVLREVVLARHRRPIEAEGYYGDEDLDGLLQRYAEGLGRAEWSIPIGTIRALREVSRWCGDRMLLLASDKGYGRIEDLEGRRLGRLSKHGSVSANANLDALCHLAVARGGIALVPRGRYTALTTVATVSTGGMEGPLPRLTTTFRDAIDGFGPAEYLRLYGALPPKDAREVSVAEILLWLRLSRWDPTLFLRYAPVLVAEAPAVDRAVRRDLAVCVDEVAARAFPLTSDHALLQAGRVRYALDDHEGAAVLFRRLAEREPDRRAAWFNLGLCLEQLARLPEAREAFSRALEIDATYERAREALARVSGADRGP